MRLIAILSLALVVTGAWASDVYRSVSADGIVIYSDRPNGPNAEPIFVAATRPEPLPPAAEPEPDSTNAAASEPPPFDEAETARIERELAEQRERNCSIARTRAENYNAAHRLFRELPNGEREYLNDAEIDEARARAASDVEAWCS